MKFELGDIFLTDYEPHFGHECGKLRPSLVIQESVLENSPYVTVMPFTSNLKMSSFDVFVSKDEKNNLKNNSVLKVRQINSFDKRRFIHFIGRANSPVIRQARGYLRKHFGL